MKAKIILVVERSGLVAADIEECIKEAHPTSRVLHAGSLDGGERLALDEDRIDLAIVSSFTEHLPKSALMRWIENSSTALAVSVPVNLDMSEFGTAHRLPTPFTCYAIRQLLDDVSGVDDDGPTARL